MKKLKFLVNTNGECDGLVNVSDKMIEEFAKKIHHEVSESLFIPFGIDAIYYDCYEEDDEMAVVCIAMMKHIPDFKEDKSYLTKLGDADVLIQSETNVPAGPGYINDIFFGKLDEKKIEDYFSEKITLKDLIEARKELEEFRGNRM